MFLIFFIYFFITILGNSFPEAKYPFVIFLYCFCLFDVHILYFIKTISL